MEIKEAIEKCDFMNNALNFQRADSDECSCALQMAISALEKQISMKPVFVHPLQFDNWIPCNERLPEEGVPVNITYKNSNPPSYYSNIKNIPFTATAISYKNKWYWYSCICLDILNEYGKNEADAVNKDIDIIAWQPLPEPYREEQEDE